MHADESSKHFIAQLSSQPNQPVYPCTVSQHRTLFTLHAQARVDVLTKVFASIVNICVPFGRPTQGPFPEWLRISASIKHTHTHSLLMSRGCHQSIPDSFLLGSEVIFCLHRLSEMALISLPKQHTFSICKHCCWKQEQLIAQRPAHQKADQALETDCSHFAIEIKCPTVRLPWKLDKTS